MPKFITGSPVTGVAFIDRKEHLPLFKSYIDNNQSIMIKAPRRFGKTSLVKHLLENNKEYKYIYVDINIVSNLRALADKITDSAYAFSNIDNFVYRAKNSLYELISSINKLKSVIPELLDMSIKFNQPDNRSDDMEYYLHSLELVNTLAFKKGINIKFVFDEFQEIVKLADKTILNRTRSIIQHHQNITYIFLGSIESIMRDIFESKASPFFHFAKIINLPPLNIDELTNYAIDIFKEKDIQCDTLDVYINFLGGHPDYSMQFLQKVYITALAYNLKKIDEEQLNKFMIETIYENKAYLDELINRAKSKKHHLDVLIAIAKNTKLNLDSKVLYNVRASLEDMGLIRHPSQATYEIVDIFLYTVLRNDGFDKIENFFRKEYL